MDLRTRYVLALLPALALCAVAADTTGCGTTLVAQKPPHLPTYK